MSPATIFRIHLALGYVPWLFAFGMFLWPWLRSMSRVDAQRAIALLHSFRFFGLAFLIPGVVGHLPGDFAPYAAYGDFATGVLAMLALLTTSMRPLFWLFVVAFNLVGVADLLTDYYHGVTLDLGVYAGELGALYVIPILYVPLLMITHVAALYMLVRPQSQAGRARVSDAAAS